MYYHKKCEDAITFNNEIWLPITDQVVPNIIPVYSVSNYGNVFSKSHNSLLRRLLDENGYYFISLCTRLEDGTITTVRRRINRLVLQVFRPIPHPELYEAHHKNANPMDNYLENLEWLTPEEHQRITKATWPRGIDAKLNGENGTNVKLSKDQVLEIKNRIMSSDYRSLASLGKEYGVAETTIFQIAKSNSWIGYGEDIPEEILRVSPGGFTNAEIEAICQYFETHDINNRVIYPSMYKLLYQCYIDLGLDVIYAKNNQNFESKRKLMTNILRKRGKYITRITDKYNYRYYF